MELKLANYEIHLTKENWYCECCGSGAHFWIELYEEGKVIWQTSQNDQFGGAMEPDKDDEEVLPIYREEEFIQGMKSALNALRHAVTVVENIDDSTPWDQHEQMDEEDGDLL